MSGEGGTNGQGLVNFSRWAKHSLTLTVIPVCIRPKYFPKQWLHLDASKLQPATSYASPFVGKLIGEVKDGSIGAQFEIQQQPQKKSQLPSITYPADYVPEMGMALPFGQIICRLAFHRKAKWVSQLRLGRQKQIYSCRVWKTQSGAKGGSNCTTTGSLKADGVDDLCEPGAEIGVG